MFGNLFNTKKGDDQAQQPPAQTPVQTSTTETTTQVGASGFAVHATDDLLGGGGVNVINVNPLPVQTTQTTTTTNQAPAAPTAPVPDPTAPGGLTATPTGRENLTALSRLDPRSTQVLHQAQTLAKKNMQQEITPEHLLYGLIYDGDVFKLLEGFNVDPAKISQELESKQVKGTFQGQPTLSAPATQIMDEGYNNAKLRGASFISPEDIMLGLFSFAGAAEFLKSQGIEKSGLEDKLTKSGDYTVGKKSMIEKYSTDLTAEAKAGTLDPVTGRDREVERLVHILLRRSKNNPIIIGEAGVGKTAIVEGLAQKIVEGSVPKDLANRRIMQLDLASLIAGASHRGEFEERFRSVIKEAQASQGTVILFIDEIHTLIGAGDDGGAMDASNIIKPYLARGQIQLIGTTTTAEFRKYFEKDKAFERRFQPVLVDEPDEDTAVKMLDVLKPKYEKFHSVTFSPEALDAAVRLSKKYVGERFLPDKAVDLLDEAAAEVKLKASEGKRKDNVVNKEDIQNVVSAWTGIPITKLTEDESQKLMHLEDLIHKRFVDQEEAVVAIAEAIRRGRIGLSAANRPIASFIFLGPTGVGKTELAKTMAEILFGKEESMIRIDMSEYMEKHEVAKLIGAPPGYVGYEEGGQLTEAVRAKPYSIVLLDEIEKAHPDVFNILLQLLEDGRLTDNKGNTISFKNTVIIATSNIGSALIQKELTPNIETMKPEEIAKKFAVLSKSLMEELRKFFRPELLNRFDDLVVFKPLMPKDMIGIAKLNLDKTRKLLKDQNFGLEITQPALDQLAKEGYDPLFGARPLRRLIQMAIENPISLAIIGKQFVPGDTILIGFDQAKNGFTFSKAAPQPNQGNQPKGQAPQPGQPTPDQSQGQPNGQAQPGQPTDQTAPVVGAAAPQQQTTPPVAPAAPQPSEPIYGFDNNGTTPPPPTPPAPPAPPQDGTQMQQSA